MKPLIKDTLTTIAAGNGFSNVYRKRNGDVIMLPVIGWSVIETSEIVDDDLIDGLKVYTYPIDIEGSPEAVVEQSDGDKTYLGLLCNGTFLDADYNYYTSFEEFVEKVREEEEG